MDSRFSTHRCNGCARGCQTLCMRRGVTLVLAPSRDEDDDPFVAPLPIVRSDRLAPPERDDDVCACRRPVSAA